MIRIKNLLSILMLLPFLWSCNDEDDINEIFVSGTWNVVNYFTKADWDKRNGEPLYKLNTVEGQNALKNISQFTLTFSDDGTFKATMNNSTFEGTWQADGKDRTVHFNIKGSPNTSSKHNKEFVETLKEATFYQGDSQVLLIAPSDKESYIQFKHGTN